MANFLLHWEIDIDAPTAEAAILEAQQAYRKLFKQDHTATRFDLCDEDGSITYFDADSEESVEEAIRQLKNSD